MHNTCTKQLREKQNKACWCLPDTTPLRFHFKWSETATEEHNHYQCLSWDVPALTVSHLICLTLLLFLLLLFLVFLLVVALTRFPSDPSCLSLSGLPRWVPSAFGGGLPRLGGVGVGIRVYLEQGEAGGGGGDRDHCRRCHCEKETDDKRQKDSMRITRSRILNIELASGGNLYSNTNITICHPTALFKATNCIVSKQT